MAPAVIDATQVRASLAFPRLIRALRQAFAAGAQTPLRHRHDLTRADGIPASLLLMPSWDGRYAGVKIVSVFPGNAARLIPTVSSSYLLADAATGQHLALIDGHEITGRRTAAASALAASFLAAPGASTLLLVGAGHIASMLPEAMRAVRPITRVLVWNRHPARAASLAEVLIREGFQASPATSLADAAAQADIISCATFAAEPLLHGAWLRPGVHVDLIGGFTPTMREADDEAIRRATVCIDSPAAVHEAGDITQPATAGLLHPDALTTLAQLCRGERPGRQAQQEITMFKSVGTALEDLAAAVLAFEDQRRG